MPFVFLAAFAVTAFWGVLSARQVERESPEATLETVHQVSKSIVRVAILGVVFLVVAVVTQVSDRLCQEFPLFWQRNASRVTWAGLVLLCGYLSAFAVTFAVTTNHRRMVPVVLALILLNAMVTVLGLRGTSTIVEQLHAKSSANGVVLQSSPYSCGAATFANIASHFDIRTTEAEAAEVLGTTTSGSTPGQIRYALDSYGFEFETLNDRTRDLEQVRTCDPFCRSSRGGIRTACRGVLRHSRQGLRNLGSAGRADLPDRETDHRDLARERHRVPRVRWSSPVSPVAVVRRVFCVRFQKLGIRPRGE